MSLFWTCLLVSIRSFRDTTGSLQCIGGNTLRTNYAIAADGICPIANPLAVVHGKVRIVIHAEMQWAASMVAWCFGSEDPLSKIHFMEHASCSVMASDNDWDGIWLPRFLFATSGRWNQRWDWTLRASWSSSAIPDCLSCISNTNPQTFIFLI